MEYPTNSSAQEVYTALKVIEKFLVCNDNPYEKWTLDAKVTVDFLEDLVQDDLVKT